MFKPQISSLQECSLSIHSNVSFEKDEDNRQNNLALIIRLSFVKRKTKQEITRQTEQNTLK
ncbi:hypothetical protein GCM10028868_14460 [Virgibacillus kimchii]